MQEGLNSCADQVKVARETIASTVLSDLEGLAIRAERVSGVVAERTNSVVLCETALSAASAKIPPTQSPEEVYPPLFDRIRVLSQKIQHSLDLIEDTMRRCEL